MPYYEWDPELKKSVEKPLPPSPPTPPVPDWLPEIIGGTWETYPLSWHNREGDAHFTLQTDWVCITLNHDSSRGNEWHCGIWIGVSDIGDEKGDILDAYDHDPRVLVNRARMVIHSLREELDRILNT
jgi:hypothetical protein